MSGQNQQSALAAISQLCLCLCTDAQSSTSASWCILYSWNFHTSTLQKLAWLFSKEQSLLLMAVTHKPHRELLSLAVCSASSYLARSIYKITWSRILAASQGNGTAGGSGWINHHPANMNVSANFHDNPSNRCRDISAWIKVVRQTEIAFPGAMPLAWLKKSNDYFAIMCRLDFLSQSH